MDLLFLSTFFLFAISVECDLLFDEEGWQAAAEFLKQGYDRKIKPCDDFLKYACGKFITNDNDTSIVHKWGDIEGKLKKDVQKSIEAIDITDKKIPKYKTTVKKFYDLCTNHTNSLKDVKKLLGLLVNILGIPSVFSRPKNYKGYLDNENIWRLLGKIHRELPMLEVLFHTEIQKIQTNCGKTKTSLRLTPKIKYYEDFDVETVLNDFQQFADVGELETYEKEAKKSVRGVVKFQKVLKEIINNETEEFVLSDLDNTGQALQTVTMDDLIKFHSNISWLKYFKGLLTEEQYNNWNQSVPTINIVDNYFFDKIGHVLKQFDMETVVNYIFWRSMKDLLLLTNSTNELNTTEGGGTCVTLAIKIFKSATPRIYLDYKKIDPMTLRRDVTIIGQTVFSTFKFLISTSDWLNDEEKLDVMKKVDTITFYSGIPQWIRNDTELNLRTLPINSNLTTIENVIIVMKSNFARDLDHLFGLENFTQDDDDPSLEINAFYTPMGVRLNMGILLPPLHNPRYLLAAKYGHIGYIIARELIRGFGLDGINEVPTNLKTLLNDDSVDTFHRKLDCLRKHVVSFCSNTKTKCSSGKTVIDDYLADIDGLKVAFMAYKLARETIDEEPPLPGFVDLMGEQVFFLFHARSLCSIGLEVENYSLKKDDPYSIDKTRFSIPLRNFPAFANSFKCETGSTYAPPHTCNIWVSYSASSRRNAS